jgi:glutathione peroxidase
MSDLLAVPVTTLQGEPTTFGALTAGRAALVVNVASRCGLTPQYGALEALHEEFAGRGFTVIGVPCNQFSGQEPGTAEEIAEFCSATYGVTFPMTEKIDVNGDDALGRRRPVELREVPPVAGRRGGRPLPADDHPRRPRGPHRDREGPPCLTRSSVGPWLPICASTSTLSARSPG